MKKRLMLIRRILLVSLIILTLYFFFYEPKYSGSIKIPDRTLVISHRGFGNHAPDNSLSAVKISLENKMNGVDLDSQLSSDNELIIFHDLSVDRLTTGTGKVKDKTLAELKKLDLGLKFKESFRGSYVSTFEDMVNEVNESSILMVELKVPSMKDTGIEKRAVEIIQKHNAYSFVYLSSFNPLVLYRLKKLDKNVKTAYIFMDTNWNEDLLKEIKQEDLVNLPYVLRKEFFRVVIRKIIKPDLLSVNVGVDERTIDKLLKKGYPVFLWTPDKEEDINSALNKKPYGIITNEPWLGKQLRDAR